jgi:hypothetical protein
MKPKIKQQIKDELLVELGTVNNSDFELAYTNASGKNKEEIKKQIKAILIQLLHDNAHRPHRTKLGKIGAVLSRIGAIILPHVNINKK